MSVAALERLQAEFGPAVYRTHSLHGDDTAVVDPARIVPVLRFLKETPELGFDMLTDLSCVDTLGLDPRSVRAIGGSSVEGDPAAGRFQVVYHLRSMKHGKRLRVKAVIDEDDSGAQIAPPRIDTVTGLYKSAIWAEREAWDMYGVKFVGHPDLRRLLLYEEFIGHPMRKDYPKEKRQPLVRRDFG